MVLIQNEIGMCQNIIEITNQEQYLNKYKKSGSVIPIATLWTTEPFCKLTLLWVITSPALVALLLVSRIIASSF